MNILKRFITIFIVLFLFVPWSYGEDKIVYLDLDNVVTNTNAGKLILDQLEKSKKSALLRFEKKEKDLKTIEDEINKQFDYKYHTKNIDTIFKRVFEN